MDKSKMHSPDLTHDNIAKIQALFPDCVTEAAGDDGTPRLAIDFDQLRQVLSDHIVEGPQERYRLDWPGKREALLTANAPVAKTMRPADNESKEFDTTQNLFIEGDNLDALKLLQESYLGKIKVIYIDPPYNTGNDLIYEDDFSETTTDFLIRSNQEGDCGERLVSNVEANGRFHSDWLDMIYPRIKIARNLLTPGGVIFSSIGWQEFSGLKSIMDEVFGSNNLIGVISRLMKSGGAKGTFFTPNIDYILVYGRNKECVTPFRMAIGADQIKTYYNKLETEGDRAGERYGEERLYLPSLDIRPNQRYWIECPDGTFVIPPGANFPGKIEDGAKIRPSSGDGVWRWTYESYLEAKQQGRIVFKETDTSALVDENNNQSKYNIYFKLWLKDQQEKGKVPPNFLGNFENRQSSAELKELGIPFDYAKPVNLIRHLIEITRCGSGDIVLDFFAGASTTAHAVMAQNAADGADRRYIMVQLPEATLEDSEAFKAGYANIADISKERIRRSGKKVLEGECHEGWNRDVGFRVLKVDSSNMADVFYRPDEVKQDELFDQVDSVKPDRTGEDLLFQVLIDWGVELTLPITRETLHGKTVYSVDGNALIACFESGISEALVKDIAGRAPLRAVFRDTSFASDADRINAEQLFRQLSPGTDVKAI